MRVHGKIGYDVKKFFIIPNGFEVDTFSPDKFAHARVCHELGISEASLLVGYVSRFHPQKDHANFIRAVAIVSAIHPDVHCVLCGDGITWENQALSALITSAGLKQNFHLLGCRSDMPSLTASFDLAVLASACGEAFPNTVGEAMACGVPCVVTDVGDSAMIVGDTGEVVPPRDPDALAEAINRFIAMGRKGREVVGTASRKRIIDHFSIERIADQYQNLYLSVVTLHA
jgi:glycosyltransferase involved in cell wall biosynthesis